jgi:manganese/zinc/iron transport system permease protein
LFKEFRLVCFDKAYAGAQGWPVTAIDLAMMALVVLVTVVGLQAVGLILIVALLIIPAAGARFWTDGLATMVVLAGSFGAVSGYMGSTISALTPRMPTGAIIVLITGILFLISMFFSPHRGLFATLLRRIALARRVAYQHLLRAMAELEEQRGEGAEFTSTELLSRRSWSAARLGRLISTARRGGFIRVESGRLALTPQGRAEAQRVLKNHRLWEMYLISYADVAPSHVDRDADEVEHVLPAALVRELERALARGRRIPPSPHAEVAR